MRSEPRRRRKLQHFSDKRDQNATPNRCVTREISSPICFRPVGVGIGTWLRYPRPTVHGKRADTVGCEMEEGLTEVLLGVVPFRSAFAAPQCLGGCATGVLRQHKFSEKVNRIGVVRRAFRGKC